MSKLNTTKDIGHTCEVLKAKSTSNGSYKLLLAVLMASLLVMCISSLPASVNIAHAQTTAADKSGTIVSTQNDQAGTWKLSGTWNFNNLNSNSIP